MPDFFNNQQPDNMQDEGASPIKIGEQEYTVDELTDLVNRGKMSREVETKYNTKLDRLMPEYTKATQRVKELEGKLPEYESKIQEYESKLAPKNGKYTDEQKTAALVEARELGLITEQTLAEKVQEIIDNRVATLLTAKDRIGETEQVINTYNQEYGIEATKKDVLDFMVQEGIKNPKYALELMFGDRLQEIRNSKLKEKYDPEFITQGSSNTGAKQYKPDIDFKNKDQVRKMLRESMRGDE